MNNQNNTTKLNEVVIYLSDSSDMITETWIIYVYKYRTKEEITEMVNNEVGKYNWLTYDINP